MPLETSQQKKFNTMLWVTAAFGLFNGFYFGSVMFAVFTEILFSITVPIAVPIGLALMCGLGWMLQASGNEWQSQNAYHATYQKYHHIKDKYEDAKKSMPKNNLTYEKYLERHSKESMNFKREKKLGDYWVRFIDSTRAVTNITKLALFCLKLTGLAVSLKLGLLGALGILPTLAIFAAAAITGVCILMINSWNEHRHAEIKRFEHEIKLMKDDIVKSKYLPPGESVLSQQKEKSEYHLFQKYLTTRFNNSSFSFWNSLPSKKVALDTKINSSGYCLSG